MTQRKVTFVEAEQLIAGAERLAASHGGLFNQTKKYRGVEYKVVDLRAEGDDTEAVLLNARTLLLVDSVPVSQLF